MYKYEIVDGQVCGTCVHYRQHYIYRDGSYFPLWYGTVIVHGARTEPRTRYARIGSQFRTPVGADALIGPQNGDARQASPVCLYSPFPTNLWASSTARSTAFRIFW